MAEHGYILVADVLGFSAMIRNTEAALMERRIAEWVDLVQSACAQCGVERYQLISDTVFAAVPEGVENLPRLVALAQTLLERGLARSFPIRGGVAHGEFTWGQLTYGRAVIAAHALESNQEWIGVACQPGIEGASALWESKRLVCYVPPMKKGPAQGHPVVNWKVPNAQDITTRLMLSNAIREGETVDWAIMQKLSNTVQFGCYLLTLEGEKLTPALFHGPLPLQLVNEVLRKRTYKLG